MKPLHDFAQPLGLSPHGQAAWEAIHKLLRRRKVKSGGGCRAFYHPTEWKGRNEKYGTDAELVVVHDGGGLAPFCNLDYGQYDLVNMMQAALREVGCFMENCTTWYSAIYKAGEGA